MYSCRKTELLWDSLIFDIKAHQSTQLQWQWFSINNKFQIIHHWLNRLVKVDQCLGFLEHLTWCPTRLYGQSSNSKCSNEKWTNWATKLPKPSHALLLSCYFWEGRQSENEISDQLHTVQQPHWIVVVAIRTPWYATHYRQWYYTCACLQKAKHTFLSFCVSQ